MAKGFTMALAALAVAGCAGAPSGPHRSGDAGEYPDVQATAPGAAKCFQTSAAENLAAANATNAARRGAGLPPVSPNATLAQAAANHACDMAKRGLMAHHGSKTTGPAQRVKALGYPTRITAENIAAGPYDLNRVLSEWNSSRGHLQNIYLPPLKEVGIGRAIGSDGRTVFWSAVYAAPKSR